MADDQQAKPCTRRHKVTTGALAATVLALGGYWGWEEYEQVSAYNASVDKLSRNPVTHPDEGLQLDDGSAEKPCFSVEEAPKAVLAGKEYYRHFSMYKRRCAANAQDHEQGTTIFTNKEEASVLFQKMNGGYFNSRDRRVDWGLIQGSTLALPARKRAP